MIIRAAILSLCLFLCGCVLQSPTPLFSDADGKPLLRSFGKQFVAYDKVKGNWEKQKELITFAPAANHYVVHDKSGDIGVVFVPLKDKWWLLQATEKGKSSTYMLAEMQGKSLLLHILSCKVLKTNKSMKDAITFKGDDCTATASMTKDRFVELTKSPEPAVLKIEAVP